MCEHVCVAVINWLSGSNLLMFADKHKTCLKLLNSKYATVKENRHKLKPNVLTTIDTFLDVPKVRFCKIKQTSRAIFVTPHILNKTMNNSKVS